MLNVHLVPHTHDDVGWLKTVDQYFYGSRLEFILGGWCMNDEASTHYNAIIDQHALGFRFLANTFGECGRPRMGFDGLFFGRLDYQDKNLRLNTTNMEFVQKLIFSRASLITDMVLLPIFVENDDKTLHDYNVDQKVQEFIKAAKDQAKHFKSNHIMMTMGGDFRYQDANMWYKNMDKIIKYVNAEACKQLNVLAKLENADGLVNKLAMAMGVLQHHDAVSGTEKQHVAYDYALRLSDGIAACESVINEAFNKLLPKRQGEPTLQYSFCGLRNISFCNLTEISKQFFVTVYNPLGIPVQPWVRVPVSGSTYRVIPVSERTKGIPERNGSIAKSDLLFQVSVGPLGISSVHIQESNDNSNIL
ncbi:hypothetical protein KUTeg_010209 [Tegillarca granosa]|uniref:Glycoside hydrolase family 38 central domain-containing protein n=1 Tax=Tegillarca granosa TaxID=220873 RepID=A0ABQ9F9E4_TEGGR|nr:hypothetical protein KUTeg_010209 [Tegillarca granosa]